MSHKNSRNTYQVIRHGCTGIVLYQQRHIVFDSDAGCEDLEITSESANVDHFRNLSTTFNEGPYILVSVIPVFFLGIRIDTLQRLVRL